VVEDISNLPNPRGFQSIKECLEHIAALEANSHQALTNQLQKAQLRASELSVRNAGLEEELGSYQAYMRDVVPQYKKQYEQRPTYSEDSFMHLCSGAE
jgi:uncharacterized damage-inducible protein DinB